ncbi:MAG: hypothetical protein AMXMBFR7_43060 [Planctomycetota bacterium]
MQSRDGANCSLDEEKDALNVLTGLVELLVIPIFMGVLYACGFLLLRPLKRVAVSSATEARTTYRLADLYVLLAQMALSGALIFSLFPWVNDAIKLVQVGALWLLQGWVWWLAVRWLARAGVEAQSRRLAVLAIAAPIGFGFPMLLIWCGSPCIEMYARAVARLPEAEVRPWLGAKWVVFWAGLGLASMASWALCSGIAEWAVRPLIASAVDEGRTVRAPMSGRRKVAWALFACSAAMLAAGIGFLYVHGKTPEGLQTATLYARGKHGDYEKATFSFEHGLRDDYFGIIKNDWDLEYGNGQNDELNVCTVTDDRSALLDLGPREWSNVGPLPALPPGPPTTGVGPNMPAKLGHMYLVRTLDTNTDLYAIFRVDGLIPNDRMSISWRLVRPVEIENLAVEGIKK